MRMLLPYSGNTLQVSSTVAAHVVGSVEEFLAHVLRVARWVDEWVGFRMIVTEVFHSLIRVA